MVPPRTPFYTHRNVELGVSEEVVVEFPNPPLGEPPAQVRIRNRFARFNIVEAGRGEDVAVVVKSSRSSGSSADGIGPGNDAGFCAKRVSKREDVKESLVVDAQPKALEGEMAQSSESSRVDRLAVEESEDEAVQDLPQEMEEQASPEGGPSGSTALPGDGVAEPTGEVEKESPVSESIDRHANELPTLELVEDAELTTQSGGRLSTGQPVSEPDPTKTEPSVITAKEGDATPESDATKTMLRAPIADHVSDVEATAEPVIESGEPLLRPDLAGGVVVIEHAEKFPQPTGESARSSEESEARPFVVPAPVEEEEEEEITDGSDTAQESWHGKSSGDNRPVNGIDLEESGDGSALGSRAGSDVVNAGDVGGDL
jgi:hypothetical protein